MKRCIAVMVLVLSVAVAGQLSITVAADANIHLPGHGVAGDLATAARENDAEKKRPWKCCYSTWCTRSIPPACRCMDAVEQCDEACSRCCEAAPSDPSKHICIAWAQLHQARRQWRESEAMEALRPVPVHQVCHTPAEI